jgi:hypothetical protein
MTSSISLTISYFTTFILWSLVLPLISSLITLVETYGNITLIFDTAGLGYSLVSTDEVIAVGKFQ